MTNEAIFTQICASADEIRDAFTIRNAVFVGEQNVPAESEVDEYDDKAAHLLARDGNTAIGAARIVTKPGGVAKIGRVAVLAAYRGQGIGAEIMRSAIAHARATNHRAAILDAQMYVVPFYERLGFAAHGGVFDDEGIPHKRMVMELGDEMTNLERLRAHFPSADKCIHLNHAGTGPAPDVAADAAQAVFGELTGADSFVAYVNHMKRQESLRAILGRMLHVAPHSLALVRNTSHGIAIMAQTIPFRSGENVVVAENEYPANVYPWMAQAHRGVGVKLVPPGAMGLVSEDNLLAACNAQTRVLAVSSVQWGTGQRMDLTKLGDSCRKRGILLCADIVQGLGQLEYKLGELPVDFAAAGCHKWLLAPAGVGALYVRPDLLGDLLPTNYGWNSVESAIDWEHLHYDDRKAGAARYEEGSPSLLAVAALEASLALVESVGFGNVYARILELADVLRDKLQRRGLTLILDNDDTRRTGIVPFRHPTHDNQTVLDALKAKNVLCAVRCGNVRFSPHAYLIDAEMGEAVATIP